MDQRKEKRIFGIKNIRITDDGRSYPVTLVNVSRQGISVISESGFPTYKEVTVEMTIDGHPVSVSASIRWVNDTPVKAPPSFKEIGLALINPPSRYRELLEEIYREEQS